MKTQLERAIQKWKLLDHPFYQAWSEGALPVERLKLYASEYGSLVRALPSGWEAVGDKETAAEEVEHSQQWDAFAEALGTRVAAPTISQTKVMDGHLNDLFSQPASALGALYAFEAQQPETAASKLMGLRQHYQLPAATELYFESHADDDHEAEKILDMLESLAPAGREQALGACETMAEDLWNVLSGVLEAEI